MSSSGKLKVTTPADRVIRMEREFDAPRDLVFAALTQPALMKRWFGVHNGWVLAVCEVDLRVGGAFRYVWRGPDGMQMDYHGTFTEIVPNARIVGNGDFEQRWHEGDELSVMELTERNGRTTLVQTVTYDSKATRDMVLKTPMEMGMEAGYAVLDDVLVGEIAKRGGG